MAYFEFLRGLRHNGFKFDLVRKKIRTYAGVLREAEAYIEATDFCSLTKVEAPAKGAEKKQSTQQDLAGKKKDGNKRKEIKDKFEFENLQPLRGPAQYGNKNKYCHYYHKDVGHDTNDYINLKRLFDKLAEKGMLNSYVMNSKFTYTRTDNTSENKKKNDKDDGNSTNSGFMAVISGGFASGGPTMKGIKQNAWNLGCDAGGRSKLKVSRILIDTGSSYDIISLAALKNLKFPEDALKDITHSLVGFEGNIIHPVGQINLPVRFGQKGEGRDMVIRFLVVKELTGYNVILGRPTLNVAKAMIVPHLMLLKIERSDGKIGSIKERQKMAKECNQIAVKPTIRGHGKSSELKGEEPPLQAYQVIQKQK
ncbi:uncharacterized protein LOC110728300 [Chenopodium quinoa]|uniref:uncharacterized protein LOC110728300 n=1 Tax=Chenopodium quinoa TaxID=63459 RepID=UPI000B78752B|nr:uncharacterized protein LOC110728300 [Chenopodium quinoa]